MVLLAGEDSGTQLARRGAEGVAALLGREAVLVPGGHVDWVPWTGGDPVRAAAWLRRLLSSAE